MENTTYFCELCNTGEARHMDGCPMISRYRYDATRAAWVTETLVNGSWMRPTQTCPTCPREVPAHYLPTMKCAVCLRLGDGVERRKVERIARTKEPVAA